MLNAVDLVGSTILGSIVILAIFGLNLLLTDTSRETAADLNVQENVVELGQLIEYDLSRIGQGDTISIPILKAVADTIQFVADVDNNGTTDTITYAKGSASLLGSTPNTNDFPIFRYSRLRIPGGTVKRDTMRISSGMTRFQITYFDSAGAATTNRARVKSLSVRLASEDALKKGEDAQRSGAAWERRIFPRNLNIPK